MANRGDIVYKAKLAEKAERYDEMLEAMKKVVSLGSDLSVEEKHLLSVAYKTVIGTRRSSWRILGSLESKVDMENTKEQIIKNYREEIEKELKDTCKDVLEILTKNLIPNATNAESKVFYHKLKGDNHRYLAEFSKGNARKDEAENALVAYKTATDESLLHLPATHPIRLGLALNFSVFYYELLNSPDQASRIAKAAFDDAIVELDTLTGKSYKKATLIIQLLRDNLTRWTSEMQDENNAKSKDQVEDLDEEKETS